MSLKKPIIKVTKKCYECRGTGKVDIRQNNKDFKKHYIKNLEEVTEYWTKKYRNKNKEAQEYLKKVKEYSKELDKVVNK